MTFAYVDSLIYIRYRCFLAARELVALPASVRALQLRHAGFPECAAGYGE